MNISILCSSEHHPVNEMLLRWIKKYPDDNITLFRKKNELGFGDLLFLISCSELITKKERNNFSKTLVIHASDLPKGRGWSPHIWAITEGETEITISLLEAEDKVDSGPIWKKIKRKIPPHALYDEINQSIFDAEEELMSFAVDNFQQITPKNQSIDTEPSYYPLRTSDNSQLDPNKSIAEQFDLIRVCDPNRYPAFFELHGKTFKLTIEKIYD